MPTVSQRIVLQSSKIPCPELFEQNIAPSSKFQTDRLAERISWTMAGLPTRTVVDTISRIWKSRHHISTPKKLMEMFPSNPSQSPHPKHWHLKVYCHGGCGLAKAQSSCSEVANDLKLNNGEKCRDQFSASKEWAMKTNHFLCSKRFNKSHQSQFEGQGSFQRLATPLSRVWMILFPLLLFVLENSRPICPEVHTPKHWHLSVNLHSSFSLAKASKVRAARWHRGTWFETQQWQGAVLTSMILHFKRWKNQPIFSAQKGPKMSKMSKTFAPPPSCCWSPLRADTKQRGGEVLVTKQMMKIYGTMGNLWKLSIIHYPLIWQLDIDI